MKFIDGIRVPYKGLMSEVEGAPYLHWARSISLAGRPQQDVALFGGLPYRDVFGGAVVAVDQTVGELRQRTWLPVLDAKNRTIPTPSLTSRDVGDAVNRCRAKGVAMVNGVGMALYAGKGDNVVGFLKELGVTPESELSKIEPLTAKKEGKAAASYVDWAVSLTAARITDPEFFWYVEEFDVVSQETGEVSRQPYQAVPRGFMVAVTVVHKGNRHTEYLPIMGVLEVPTKNGPKKMDHRPLIDPTAFDWNRSVMRCLAKAIAVVSGYGLSVYAKEDVQALQVQPMLRRVPAGQDASGQGSDPAGTTDQEPAPESPEMVAARAKMAADIEILLQDNGKSRENLMRFLGKAETQAISELSEQDMKRAIQALSPRKKAA